MFGFGYNRLRVQVTSRPCYGNEKEAGWIPSVSIKSYSRTHKIGCFFDSNGRVHFSRYFAAQTSTARARQSFQRHLADTVELRDPDTCNLSNVIAHSEHRFRRENAVGNPVSNKNHDSPTNAFLGVCIFFFF